jgi:ATP-dependent DNA helicase PIF1
MAHKQSLEALNMTMQDLQNYDLNMEGVTVLLAGDFRQALPVIPRLTGADESNMRLKSSHLWKHVHIIGLTTNMRIRSSANQHNATFADQLLTLGNRKIPVDSKTGRITFPSNFCTLVESTEEFISKVFAYLHENFNRHKWISESAILAPKNASVNKINLRTLRFLPGNGKSYLLMDSIVDLSEAINYPPEFLNP